jgi:hypothetical protein
MPQEQEIEMIIGLWFRFLVSQLRKNICWIRNFYFDLISLSSEFKIGDVRTRDVASTPEPLNIGQDH